MIGGIVDEVVMTQEKLWVNCRDTVHPKDTCAIYVEVNNESSGIKVGDRLWWQGKFAMWTPNKNTKMEVGKNGIDYDIEIPRIGYSGVSKPFALGEKI